MKNNSVVKSVVCLKRRKRDIACSTQRYSFQIQAMKVFTRLKSTTCAASVLQACVDFCFCKKKEIKHF